MFGSKPNHRPIKETIQQSAQSWYDEYKNVPSLEEVKKLGSSGVNFRSIGHWSQLVQSKAHRIGCSVVQFTDPEGWKQTLIGCNYRLFFNIIYWFIKSMQLQLINIIKFNYSAGNTIGNPIFTFGPPASLCKTGKNPKYPGLCNPKEDVSQHKNGVWYFNNNAPQSPIVRQWLKNGKKINL